MLRSFLDFLNYCRSLEGVVLHTRSRSKAFSVQVENESLWFIPESSGKRRRAHPEKTEQVLAELQKSEDWSPGSYQEITFHASYILAVAHKHDKEPV